ncbi:MAG: hypothetical protein WEG36_15200 [Gemmatimonadota bacterium]
MGASTASNTAPPDINLLAPPVTAEDSIGGFTKFPNPNTTFQNPLWVEGIVEDEQREIRTLASAQLRWDPAAWVSFFGNISYDREDSKTRNYTPLGVVVGTDEDGNLSYSQGLNDTWNAELQASLRRDFGPLNTRVTIRGLMERDREEDISASGNVLVIKDTPTLEAVPSSSQFSGSSEEEVRSNGWLVDTAFDYDARYILTALVRRDGSSLFGREERWQTYYRVAGKWRISEEDWFNIPNVDELGISVSRGTAGGRPPFSAQYEVWSLSNGVPTKSQLGNRFLRPSQTVEHDVSVNAVLFDRWEMTATYAWQQTSEQLQTANLLAFYGYPTQWQNGGTIEGNTIEFTLNAPVIQTPRFGWTTTFVADRSDSVIEEWPFACESPAWRFRCAGRGVYEVWGYNFVTSDALFEAHRGGELIGFEDQFDRNDDGYLVWVGEGFSYTDGAGTDDDLNTGDDLWGTSTTIGGETYNWGIPFRERDGGGGLLRKQVGDAAHINLGWINNFNFGAFSLHAQLHAKVGGDVQNTQHQYMIPDDVAPMMDQAGRPTGLKKPRAYWTTLYSDAGGTDFFNEDGSYLKLRQVILNYRVPQSQLARLRLSDMGISSLTLGLIGRELATWTNYRGFDPEQGLSLTGGSQTGAGGTYPPTSSYTLEFQVTF